MEKNILVFSNGEKIGDGLIKIPLLHEIKKRLPEHKLIWMTNNGVTVYNSQLKNIAFQYIDQIIEKSELSPFFWQKISKKFDFNNVKFEYILDTQKALLRTIALKRIQTSLFISATASFYFSDKKIKYTDKNKIRKYYLEDLYDLLNLIKIDSIDQNFKIPIPNNLQNKLSKIFKKNNSYIGIAPGAGEKNKIWPIENFIEVAEYFEKKFYNLVFFLGPQENSIKKIIKEKFPKSIFPEENINDFSGPEIVMASTKHLSCALANDSGVSHMLSTNLCPVLKLFGPKDSSKFTPIKNTLHTISAKEFGSNNIEVIKSKIVINKMEKLLS
tara:strand:+ start:9971 stop:10954 length:984 start_codon:yes stop_codon:yes gene_type:complete